MGRLGAILRRLGAILHRLGASYAVLGTILGRLGPLAVQVLKILAPPWPILDHLQ